MRPAGTEATWAPPPVHLDQRLLFGDVSAGQRHDPRCHNDNPAPAVIHWVSPSVISPPPPLESWCRKTPSSM
jgi:hypothetical protein